MPYFECTGCGTMANLTEFEATARREYCPTCEERTTWEPVFESEEGISF